ncbi:hypothetical protein ACFY1A_17210 [Streptomyces sp. NPDC001520]|uniref:hypothetical protein n=1 Tax=Streptomyces sp. NPDC001520 TaxID=3364581 RepID=UPI003697EF54
MKQYVLIRVTPTGEVKAHSPQRLLVSAANSAAHVLADNTSTSKADAQRFAARLSRHPLEEDLTHEPTGYRFRIERTEP